VAENNKNLKMQVESTIKTEVMVHWDQQNLTKFAPIKIDFL